MYQYFAEVLRVIDGDTIKARVDLGMSTYTVQSIRLRGIDAAEINTAAGQVSTMFVKMNLPPGRKILIDSYGLDKYGRWLCDIHLDPAAAPEWNPGDGNDQNQLDYTTQSATIPNYELDFAALMLDKRHAIPMN